MDSARPCPCQSGASYGECCLPYHRGERHAPTAEALMRSRYSAFAVGDEDYLLASWHPATRPGRCTLEPRQRWTGLTIESTRAGRSGMRWGWVCFEARYEQEGVEGRLRECSRFECIDGRWYYRDGEIAGQAPRAVGRNAPCPCGSGRKYKRCCG